MTVNDVNQAIRNLMNSQPMITTGPLGTVISNALNIVESFRAFSMSVSAYPIQDSLKFNMMSEVSRLDNTLSMLVCQTFQEKGLNLLVFMPSGQNGMIQPQVQPSYTQQNQGVLGSLIFNQSQPRFGAPQMNVPPVGAQQMQGFQQPFNAGAQYMAQPQMYGVGAMQGQQMPQMQGRQNAGFGMMPNPAQSQMGGASLRGMQKTMPTRPMPAPRPQKPFNYGGSRVNAVNPNPKMESMANETQEQPAKATVSKPKDAVIPTPVAQPTNAVKNTKSQKKPAAAFLESQDISTTPVKESEKSDDSGDQSPPSNTAGRDYLLQLLKK